MFSISIFELMKTNQIPNLLSKGDTVAIMSPARKIEKELIDQFKEPLETKGLNVLIGENVFNENNQYAGTEIDKLKDFQSFLDNPNVKAIFFSRGGYGSSRFVDQVNFQQFYNKPKWLVGFSDTCVFLNHVSANGNIASLHAPMPSTADENDFEYMMKFLFKGEIIENLHKHSLNREGDCEGDIVGGNLSIVYSIRGTKSEPNFERKILFLEDLDEYLYHIDRMMVNLKRGGVLESISGLIVGYMSDMNDNSTPYGKTAEEIIYEHVEEFKYPVYFGYNAGHLKPNKVLPFGMKAKIQSNRLILSSLSV